MKTCRIEAEALQQLIEALRDEGYTVIAPREQDGVVMYGPVETLAAFPEGIHDETAPGSYRTHHVDGDSRWFANTPGQRSMKNFLYPPTSVLCRMKGSNADFVVEPDPEPAPKYAFLGVRSCDLHAVALQDDVFVNGPYPDAHYSARRESALFIAVSCTHPGSNCFCASMGTGPAVNGPCDVALTEVASGGEHYFLAEAQSGEGEALLAELPHREARDEELSAAEAALDAARQQMSRKLDMTGLKELLYAHRESPQWEAIAERCMACGNCTMACPTCFCSTVEDTTSITGDTAERTRVWDSCFTMDFSYIHGGSVRSGGAARYRQWLTHKLATWQDQFGAPGCVGCGRCITWCPVGIDITEEAAALQQRPA